MTQYYDTCKCVYSILLNLQSNIDLYEDIDVFNISNEIVNVVVAANPLINNAEYVDAYIKHIVKNRCLEPQKVSYNGSTPLGICCALFGIWSAVPLLMRRDIINNDNVPLSQIVNFCIDLLNDFVPGVGETNNEQDR